MREKPKAPENIAVRYGCILVPFLVLLLGLLLPALAFGQGRAAATVTLCDGKGDAVTTKRPFCFREVPE